MQMDEAATSAPKRRPTAQVSASSDKRVPSRVEGTPTNKEADSGVEALLSRAASLGEAPASKESLSMPVSGTVQLAA